MSLQAWNMSGQLKDWIRRVQSWIWWCLVKHKHSICKSVLIYFTVNKDIYLSAVAGVCFTVYMLCHFTQIHRILKIAGKWLIGTAWFVWCWHVAWDTPHWFVLLQTLYVYWTKYVIIFKLSIHNSAIWQHQSE